ncbi:MAG TPA: T9SS type A sorting domain-containing protein, partial [Saprospiraceae bacterium]|nr:T9SS type A sorting domain-containing protein [Saprospiraceae bacterium]
GITDAEINIAPKFSYINCKLVIIDATVASPFGDMEYQWNTGDISPYLTAPTIPGTFTLTVTNVLCGISATDTIQVKPCGQLAGSVLLDNNKNCVDDGETPLASWIVKAESSSSTYYGTTQSDGHYNILVEQGQLYTVSAVAQNPLWMPCLSSNAVLVALPFDSVPGGDFLFKKQEECPMMEVYLSSGNLRRCFNNNVFKVRYCNFGTAAATNAYVILTLDAALKPVSSNLLFTPLGGNRYRFNVGNVGVGQCGDFHVYAHLDCNVPLGATHCSEAHIFPDTLCQPPNMQWSGASLRVSSTCVGDSVQFVLKNVGTGNMPKGLEYIVIEDVVMMMKALVQLKAGDSILVKVPARGSTWRMEVEQEPFHPGLSRPASWVEGCNASTTFSTGMVNVYPPDDADKFIDVYCIENTAAYDPNDKQALPTGYGTAHYVSPNTPLEYLIRFQNTGNDTAFTVVLRDTLSPWLDPATVRPGAASHPYTWDLSGTGFLTFRFEHILLPDTATNPDASHSFVQYTIWPKEGTPLESQVLNRAGIYFDFNPPIITNQTWHTLGRNFMISSTWQPRRPDYQVRVQPNPASEEARLEVLGLPDAPGDFLLQVFDAQGHVLRHLSGSTPAFVLQAQGLPSGLYFFQVLADGKLVGSGKLAVER